VRTLVPRQDFCLDARPHCVLTRRSGSATYTGGWSRPSEIRAPSGKTERGGSSRQNASELREEDVVLASVRRPRLIAGSIGFGGDVPGVRAFGFRGARSAVTLRGRYRGRSTALALASPVTAPRSRRVHPSARLTSQPRTQVSSAPGFKRFDRDDEIGHVERDARGATKRASPRCCTARGARRRTERARRRSPMMCGATMRGRPRGRSTERWLRHEERRDRASRHVEHQRARITTLRSDESLA
jgi:hypothetical protein